MVEESFTQRVKEQEMPESLPSCDNVGEFFACLRGTSEYNHIVEERFRKAKARFAEFASQVGKALPPTRKEVAAVFEEREEFKQLFWDFDQDVIHLKYNPEKYSSDFQEKFASYKVAVKESLKASQQGKDREEMEEKDRQRSIAHDEAAKVLVVDGVVANEFLARMVIRAFLVDVGCDYIPSARQADQLRILRSLTDRAALIQFLTQTFPLTKEVRRFSPETTSVIQDSFLQSHPSVDFVSREKFLIKPVDLSSCLPPQGDQENVLIPRKTQKND